MDPVTAKPFATAAKRVKIPKAQNRALIELFPPHQDYQGIYLFYQYFDILPSELPFYRATRSEIRHSVIPNEREESAEH